MKASITVLLMAGLALPYSRASVVSLDHLTDDQSKTKKALETVVTAIHECEKVGMSKKQCKKVGKLLMLKELQKQYATVKSGVQQCEGHDYEEKQCMAVGCCTYAFNCFTAVVRAFL
jgi:hypothetical protein